MNDGAPLIEDRDARLAALLEEVARKQAAGQPVGYDQLARDHPDLIDELRQLLAVGQIIQVAHGTSNRAQESDRALREAATPGAEFGHYRLHEEIGRGGMGVVYKAWDQVLKRYVALKLMLRGRHASAEDLGRFRSEAEAVAGLTHPNIVPVFEVGEHAGHAYFAMKYVPGLSLSSRAKQGPLPSRKAAEYVRDIAQAVQHAHEKGIYHRDLKPSNVLLDEDDRPLVTDFGLAKRVEGGVSLTGTGAVLGTPSYMPPEQAEGSARPLGPQADVYSLGAILYELLTGRPPFLAPSAFEILLLVRSEEPIRPRLLNPQIDPDLELITRKCLEKQAKHRYARAADLAQDLEAYLNGNSVSARSGDLADFISRVFRETHHAPVLENWGLLWIWQSIVVLLLCGVTSAMHELGVRSHWAYVPLWSLGLIVWGGIFWRLRKRGGPVTFVERQIAHAWTAGITAAIGTFLIEVLLDLPALTLTPMLAVISGMIFLVKAGTLGGWFYFAAAALFASAIPVAVQGPPWSPLLFGLVLAIAFFVPGVKYYRKVAKLSRGETQRPSRNSDSAGTLKNPPRTGQ